MISVKTIFNLKYKEKIKAVDSPNKIPITAPNTLNPNITKDTEKKSLSEDSIIILDPKLTNFFLPCKTPLNVGTEKEKKIIILVIKINNKFIFK